MSRVGDVPFYEQREDCLPARLYNLWRRAKLHFKFPIRISLPMYPGMTMLLEENEWVCVDERQNDLPVLAWVEFKDQHRDALHLPVKCKLNYYHFAASKLRVAALTEMEQALERRLQHESTNTTK